MNAAAGIHVPLQTILGLACLTCDAPWPCSHAAETVSEKDPLKAILESAVDAKEALYAYVWQQHYASVTQEEMGVQWADEEADQILTLLFPYFKSIMLAGQRKARLEGIVAANAQYMDGVPIPASPYDEG